MDVISVYDQLTLYKGFPGGASGKETSYHCRRPKS